MLALVAVSAATTVAQSHTATTISPDAVPVCPGGCGHGGGGGGGGTPPASGGPLTFGATTLTGLSIGGVSGRQSPGITLGISPNTIAYVYTSPNDPYGDSEGDQYVYYGTSQQQPARISAQGGAAASTANPAIQNVVIQGLPILFLAVNSQQTNVGNGNFGGFADLFEFSNGTWSVPSGEIPSNVGPSMYSPALTASSQFLFTALQNAADRTLIICRTDVTINNGATTCVNHPGSTPMMFNPGIAYWNGVLYMAFEDDTNNHTLRMFTSTDNGQTIAETTNIAINNQDQSSSAPTLAIANNALYVGFRSNDGSVHTLYKYSTDGTNYTASTDTGVPSASGPNFLTTNIGASPGSIYNYFTTNDSNHDLEDNIAPVP